jgi:LysM repeat protein
METNESNLKPQPTGGLKLMTVFIAVLALHVIVIGGFTVYTLLKPALNDQDVAVDKNHKAVKVLPDGSLVGDLPDSDTTDKSAGPATASTDTITPPATTASDTTTPPADTASTPTPPAPSVATETPSAASPVTETQPAPVLAGPTAQTPSGPIQHGPVIDPPENLAPTTPEASSTAPSAAPTESAPIAADGASYVVKPGDSLARIARQHHVSLAKLRAANSFANDRLHIGQKIVLPNRTQTVALAANAEAPAGPAAPADATAVSLPVHHATAKTGTTSSRHFYTVVKGDTLIKIARRFRTTPTAIMAANNLTDAGRIGIGKKLKIPSGESRSAATSAPASEPAESKAVPKGQLANFVQ